MAAFVLAYLGVPKWGVFVQEGIALVLVGAFLGSTFLSRQRGVLRADAGGLSLDGRAIATRAAIASAYVASAEEAVVRIDRRRGLSFFAKLEEETDARALVAALGFGATESVVSVRGFGLLALGVRLDVGADGLLVRRFGQRRFVSYEALTAAEADGAVLSLVLTSGERIALRLGVTAPAVAARIEEARAAFADDRVHADALIGPAGRSLARWLKDLRTATKTRAYRDPHTDPETLWRVLGSASSSPATRAGAALALSAGMDDPSRARLRVAAEACVEPKLRIALLRVAEGASDAELEEALAPLLESKG